MGKYELGITLSGGGARGFAHLAALQAMKERGITPHILSGTSAGSLAAAFYAAGHEPEDVKEFFKEAKLTGLLETTLARDGIFKTSRLEAFLYEKLQVRTFEDLRLPIRVIASDIEEGKMKVFSEGELIPALVASCCLPVIFTPLQIDGHYYIDGGIFSNFPTSVIRNECKTLIGVNVSPVMTMSYRKSIKYIVERTMNYTIGGNSMKERQNCDYLIEYDTFSDYSVFSLDKADEIYRKGYEQASAYLDQNKESLQNRLSPCPGKRISFPWKKLKIGVTP